MTAEMTARTECDCHPVILHSSASVAPLFLHSITVIDAILLLFAGFATLVAPTTTCRLWLLTRCARSFFAPAPAARFFFNVLLLLDLPTTISIRTDGTAAAYAGCTLYCVMKSTGFRAI